MIKRAAYAIPFFSGLIVSQILSTIHVYLSNQIFFQKIDAIGRAGYLTVPAGPSFAALKSVTTAANGGVFFSFTIGLGLTAAVMAAAWIWRFNEVHSPVKWLCLAVLWVGPIIMVNANGLNLMASAYFLLVPPVVFILAIRLWPPQEAEDTLKRLFMHLVCFAILAIAARQLPPAETFGAVRDRILMNHPTGIAVTEYYYRYTLYAAQVFKSMEQDLIRACRLNGSDVPPRVERRIRKSLIRHDYLPIPEGGYADLVIDYGRDQMMFRHRGKTVLTVPTTEFLRHTGKTLRRVSRAVDNNANFRLFVYLSLLFVTSVGGYLLLYGLCYLLVRPFAGLSLAAYVAAPLCLVAAGLGLWYLSPQHHPPWNTAAIYQGMISPEPGQRIDALKAISENHVELGLFKGYKNSIHSPHLVERYWLATALKTSKKPETYDINIALLDDGQINVAYMAYNAIGQRGERRAIKEITSRLPQSAHWYQQFYAYKALRRLGWTQDAPP